MASQQTPQSYEPLVQLFADAADGARDHGASVGLKQNTFEVILPELEALTGTPAGPDNTPPAVPGLKARWNTAKAYKISAGGQFRIAKSNGRAVATACVNVLKPRLGNRWSNDWQLAGFTAASLEIPDNPLALLQQLRAYFAANPTHEMADLSPTLSATASACEAAARAIIHASTASNQSNAAAGNAKNALQTGLRAARKRLSGLREELSKLLGRDDERWYAFGFDRPDDPEVPEVPAHLTVTPGLAGTLIIDWDDARRAESYRIEVLDRNTSAPLAERIVTESETAFTGLATGQAVKIRVSARNGKGGESGYAPVVAVVVP